MDCILADVCEEKPEPLSELVLDNLEPPEDDNGDEEFNLSGESFFLSTSDKTEELTAMLSRELVFLSESCLLLPLTAELTLLLITLEVGVPPAEELGVDSPHSEDIT